MKHGKVDLLSGESTIPDSAIAAIAKEMDKQAAMDGDFEIPEEYRTSLSDMKPPRASSIVIQPTAESETQKMMDAYVKQNGSYIVPKGQSAEGLKRELKGGSSDELLLG